MGSTFSCIRYAERAVVRYGVLDGKQMQPFLKFCLKAEINFLIEVFFHFPRKQTKMAASGCEELGSDTRAL